MKQKKEIVQTDLLIIGGGAAGCIAAIGAREQGDLDVLVLEKAEISRSGDAGGGNDHLLAHLNTGEAWDTDQAMAEYYTRVSQGLIDIRVANRLHISRIREIVDKLESFGIEMKDPKTGQYIRTKSFGQPGPFFINYKGKKIKPILAKEVKKRGVEVLNRINVTNLLTDGKQVVGAMGFNVRSGAFYVVKSKTTLLATGDVVRLWPSSSGLAFNTWMSPYNNGAGHVMAFRAGAELANMEITVNTLVPKGFSAAGLNAFVGMGAYFLNSLGERYMQKVHPMGEGAPRYLLTLGTYRETMEGRGPCYVDCRHLPKEAMHHLTTQLLPVDKDTFMTFCRQKGIDLKKALLEIEISETQSAGIAGSVSGIVIDEEGKTTVDRLYAAGACTVPSFGLSGALAIGYSVGIEAAKASLRIPKVGEHSEREVEKEFQSVYAALNRKEGFSYQRFENKLRQIMGEYVGDIKTEKGLEIGLQKLRELERRADDVKAENYHELMRVTEFKDLLLIGRLIAIAALERKESRMGLSHMRGDYPDQDDRNFHGSIILRRDNGGISVTFRPAPGS
ncbi:MAG: FAD-binding protein [Deltaproteobacteria bacterium]